MSNHVLALSLNHRSAPLDLRGRLAFAPEHLPQALRALRERLGPTEPGVTLLSTCNRTELYVESPNDSPAESLVQPAMSWLAEQGHTTYRTLQSHVHVALRSDAARHAFRVASGLDSMVLGEPQILGQVKLAVREACSAGTLGSTLHQMFQRAFSVAKEVRSTTDIGAHCVSMSAAAVRLAQQLFEDLSQVRVLFVGAGEMMELAAAHFAGRKPLAMTVANRGRERGDALARRFGCQTMSLAALPARLHEFDVVVSCTASSLPIIGLGAVERALKLRRRRPMFMVDLAVPRDIDPEVSRLSDIYLYTVDDLSAHLRAGGQLRQAAVQEAERIVEAGVCQFEHWLEQRENVPLIRAVHARADAWREAALQRARRQLARGDDPNDVLEALSKGLTAKLMHGALSELHQSDPTPAEPRRQTLTRIYLHSGTRQAA
jgi:glutamyl-tRNA reductase